MLLVVFSMEMPAEENNVLNLLPPMALQGVKNGMLEADPFSYWLWRLKSFREKFILKI